MHILLFVFYGVIGCYTITRMSFFRDSRIRPPVLRLLFGLWVGAGCLHNFIAWRYFPNHGDIWNFFRGSLISKHDLLTDLHRFVADNPIAYLPYNALEIVNLIFDFFSFDNFYINTLFFSFLVFAGSIALFRFFRENFGNSLLCGCAALLIPSTVFWTACIHKEGLIYMLLGFFYFHFYKGVRKGWTPGKILLCGLLFGGIILFRTNMLVTILPALALWVIGEKRGPSRRMSLIFSALFGAILLLGIIRPGLFTGVLHYVAAWQGEFQGLEGNSKIDLPRLAPTFGSFWHVLPVAILNGFFEPLPGSGGQFLYLIFAVELLFIWVIVFFAFYYSLFSRRNSPSAPLHPDRRPRTRLTPFGLSCILLSFTAMLMIGYTVPFVGAIVRYRSIYLPFLLAPFLYAARHHPLAIWLSQRLTRLLMIHDL